MRKLSANTAKLAEKALNTPEGKELVKDTAPFPVRVAKLLEPLFTRTA